MTFTLSNRSLDRLKGVHPRLVEVVKRAIQLTSIDFMVIEGIRSLEQQKHNVASGASQTMKSRHLIQDDGYGHAVDLAPLVGKEIPWKDFSKFKEVSEAMKKAASELGVRITWGGDWKTLVDGPHYQIEL